MIKKMLPFAGFALLLVGAYFFARGSLQFFNTRQNAAPSTHGSQFVASVASSLTSPSQERSFVQKMLDPVQLEKFVDPLPLPQIAQPKNITNGVAYYEMHMREFKQKLHRDLPETTVWGYEGSFPGPTIEARTDMPVQVKWFNDLSATHLFPVDRTIMGADDPNAPEARAVVHLHGGHVPAASDGDPESWFGPGSSSSVYEYPNKQSAAMLWYHDHALGITRLNVYAGLAGLYMIRDANEDAMNLPKGDYEMPIVIQDRSFSQDGSLYYGAEPPEKTSAQFPSIQTEFFGSVNLVNGKVWPYVEVEPKKYRLRVLNGSNGRFYRLSFSNGMTFAQIGTEGGFLDAPVNEKEVLLAPAERADIIVDFSKQEGQNIILSNYAPAPFPGGNQPDAHTSQVMQFRVRKKLSGADTSVIPALGKIVHLKERDAKNTRTLTLQEDMDEFGRMAPSLDGKKWSDPVSENPKLGSTEIWNLVNTTPDAHPIHLHLVKFQILDRQPFDVDAYKKTGKIIFTGKRKKPDANESNWKDTIRATQGEVTRIIINFNDYAGKYVWHCHILEHEDHDMMRPMEVVP